MKEPEIEKYFNSKGGEICKQKTPYLDQIVKERRSRSTELPEDYIPYEINEGGIKEHCSNLWKFGMSFLNKNEDVSKDVDSPKNRVLFKCKGLVIGPMEADLERGRKTREILTAELSKMGITVWDHYNKPFINSIDECEDTHEILEKYRENEEYNKIAEYRSIRLEDLSLVDCCDFVICVFEKKTFTVGTFEELFVSNKIKKPIFFVWGEGKKKCPFWVFWTIPHRYIYNSVEEVIETLKKINSGEKELDSDRWRLMKPEFR